jgi:hypothetical protein
VAAESDELWYESKLDVFLNKWFAHYEEARAARAEAGGFLLPYRRHFYVCQPEVIRALGLEPDDADWERIGWDCARPADEQVYQRLRAKREAVMRAEHG